MKKYLLYLFWFILGLLVGYLLCSNYGWGSKDQANNPQPTAVAICDALTNISPLPGDQVTSPITVTATVDNTKSCKWTVFEAQAGTMEVKNSSGNVIGTGTLTTTADWMTDLPVEYTGTITLSSAPTSSDITLTIMEDDPSGQSGQEVTIPLIY